MHPEPVMRRKQKKTQNWRFKTLDLSGQCNNLGYVESEPLMFLCANIVPILAIITRHFDRWVGIGKMQKIFCWSQTSGIINLFCDVLYVGQWAQSASCTTEDGVLYYPNTWYGMQILLWTEEYVFFTYRKIIGKYIRIKVNVHIAIVTVKHRDLI